MFGQVDWAVSDWFTLSAGIRYTDETKDMDAVYIQTANGPPPDLGAIFVALTDAGTFLGSMGQAGSLAGLAAGDLASVTQPNVDWGLYQFAPFAPRPNVDTSLKDDQTTGTFKLSFYPND